MCFNKVQISTMITMNKTYDEIFQSFLIDITLVEKITSYLINKKVGIISVITSAACSDAPFILYF